MLFFINPAHRSAHRKRKAGGLTRRRVKRQTRRTKTGGNAMARRRRNKKTGRFVRAGAAPRRRRRVYRRRRTVARAAAPRRRRRTYRRRAMATNPRRRRRHVRRRVSVRRRRRYARNPSLPSVRGLTASIVQGLKDAVAVKVGEIATRKVSGAVKGMMPADWQARVATGAGRIALSIGSALGVAVLAKRFAPAGYARIVVAGAFSEAADAIISQTPVLSQVVASVNGAGAMAAYPRRVVRRLPGAVGAYPTVDRSGYNVPAGRFGAYPMPVQPMMYQAG